VVAANIDIAFIVMGLDADFNVRRLTRYLTLAHASGAQPVVLLTKAGSCTSLDERLRAARATAGSAAVEAIDVITGIAADAPARYLATGATAALLGSSGVGKSTLLNYLLGGEHARTAETRAADGKGRHTTTHRELFEVPTGGAIIDTPGMRELALWCDEEALGAAFGDVTSLAAACRFRDCRHLHDPGCAVRRAIEDGQLAPDRVELFEQLRDEVDRGQARREEWRHRAAGRAGSKMAREAMRTKYGRLR
jgi:ribosome biogenesis GTPase